MAEGVIQMKGLTSPGQIISRKLLSRFAISGRGIGLTPLICTIWSKWPRSRSVRSPAKKMN